MLILLALPLQPPAHPAAPCGPPAPALKGVAPRSASFSLARASRAALREIPGAIVMVEDEAPTFLTQMPPSMKLLRGHLRVFSGQDQPTFPATPPIPVWMDPAVTTSGGNVVNRLFSVGGGSY